MHTFYSMSKGLAGMLVTWHICLQMERVRHLSIPKGTLHVGLAVGISRVWQHVRLGLRSPASRRDPCVVSRQRGTPHAGSAEGKKKLCEDLYPHSFSLLNLDPDPRRKN